MTEPTCKVEDNQEPTYEQINITGVQYVFRPRTSAMRRTLWIFVLVGSLAWMVFNIHSRVSRYQTQSTSTNMNVQYQETLPFPAVTFCNKNIARTRAMVLFSKYLNSVSIPNYNPLMGLYQSRPSSIYKFISRYFNLLRMPTGPDQKLEAQRMAAEFTDFEGNGFDNKQFYGYVSHQLEEMIVDCTWNNQKCRPDHFTASMTDMGICYTFNGDNQNILHGRRAGTRGGLTMHLNIQQYHYMTSYHDSVGLHVLVSDPTGSTESRTLLETRGQSISIGTHTVLAVQPHRYEELQDCDPENSIHHCQLHCITEYVVDTCGCKNSYEPGNNTCIPIVEAVCSRPARVRFAFASNRSDYCECQPKCKRLEYEVTQSQSMISKHIQRKLHYLYEYPNAVEMREITNIGDWAAIEDTRPRASELISKISQNMYTVHSTLVFILETLQSLLMKSQSSETLNLDLQNLKRTLNLTLNWMLTTELFNFVFTENFSEDFNIRLAVDVIHNRNHTGILIIQLNETLSGMIRLLESATENINESNTTSTNATVNILNELHKCNLLLNIINVDYLELSTDIKESRIPLQHQHFEITSNFFRHNFVRVDVMFQKMTETILIQQLTDNFNLLACELGGTMGLCLGGSLLTIFDLINIITLRWHITVSK